MVVTNLGRHMFAFGIVPLAERAGGGFALTASTFDSSGDETFETAWVVAPNKRPRNCCRRISGAADTFLADLGVRERKLPGGRYIAVPGVGVVDHHLDTICLGHRGLYGKGWGPSARASRLFRGPRGGHFVDVSGGSNADLVAGGRTLLKRASGEHNLLTKPVARNEWWVLRQWEAGAARPPELGSIRAEPATGAVEVKWRPFPVAAAEYVSDFAVSPDRRTAFACVAHDSSLADAVFANPWYSVASGRTLRRLEVAADTVTLAAEFNISAVHVAYAYDGATVAAFGGHRRPAENGHGGGWKTDTVWTIDAE